MDYWVLLSPAKRINTLEWELPFLTTKPTFEKRAAALIQELQSLENKELQSVMEVNGALLSEVKIMLERWVNKNTPRFPAAAMYNGDAYMRLCARDWDAKTWQFAQDHLVILSAVYGALRATDAVRPYRLMVGSRWKGKTASKGLYPFWQPLLSQWMEKNGKGKTLLNLASQEYAQMLDACAQPRINIDFKVLKGGKLMTVSSFSKQARGAMARWIMENRPKTLHEIQAVSVLGFCFDPKFSDKENWIFIKG